VLKYNLISNVAGIYTAEEKYPINEFNETINVTSDFLDFDQFYRKDRLEMRV
jgi:hypothetical protein